MVIFCSGGCGCLNAAEFSCDLGLQEICLEGDTLQIVNGVKTNERN
jgi:hypothetical protein